MQKIIPFSKRLSPYSTSSNQIREISAGSQSKDKSGINPERSITIKITLATINRRVLTDQVYYPKFQRRCSFWDQQYLKFFV